MPELIRSIVGRLREFAGDRRHAYRRRLKLPVTVSIHQLTGQAHVTGQLNGRRPVPAMQGHTRDISSTGLGLILPAIRIGEHYLTGEDRLLRIVLELPSGPIELIVAPVRYEPLGDEEDEQGFVIGARITDLSAQDREHFMSAVKGR
ncbi:MAG TPA: PilZ domain-containing protein [Pyrinomonadaceae bacterium]|nr:PilZ domain-containing protein [Pyrinomonadaceae bacterium]